MCFVIRFDFFVRMCLLLIKRRWNRQQVIIRLELYFYDSDFKLNQKGLPLSLFNFFFKGIRFIFRAVNAKLLSILIQRVHRAFSHSRVGLVWNICSLCALHRRVFLEQKLLNHEHESSPFFRKTKEKKVNTMVPLSLKWLIYFYR